MKKLFTLTAAALISVAASQQIEAKTLIVALDRTHWSVTGCSERNQNPNNGSDRGYAQIIDGNNATYWHSNYNGVPNTYETSGPHYLVIDRGDDYASHPFNQLGYLPRQHENGNGFCNDYRIFVVDNVTGLDCATATNNNGAHVTSHASLETFISDNSLEPAASGTFNIVYNQVSTHGMQLVNFDEEQTGRYVIFVFDSVSSSSAGLYANCAELYLYHAEEVNIDRYLNNLSVYENLIPADAYNTIKSQIESANHELEIIEAYGNVVNALQNQVITIKNVRRSEANGKYLGYTPADSRINTYTAVNEYCKWMMRRVDGEPYFYLFNPESGRLMVAGGHNAQITTTENINSATKFTFVKNTDATYPGTAIVFGATTTGNVLNVNEQHDPCVAFGYNDGGSSWEIARAASYVRDLITDGSAYYRIRSSRATARRLINKDSRSLVGINTVAENGDDPAAESHLVVGRGDGLGALWTIHDAGNGKVYLRNAAAKFEGQDACFGLTGNNPDATSHENPAAQQAFVSATPAAVEIRQAKGAANSSFNGNERAAAISTNPAHNLYLDNTGDANSYPKFNGWDRVDATFPDNGGVYYFELAEDYDAVEAAYIAAATAKVTKDPVIAEVNSYGTAAGVWTPKAVAAAIAKVEEMEAPAITTVEQANAGVDFTPTFASIKNELIASANGKTVRFENVERNNGAGHFITYVTNDKTHNKDGEHAFITKGMPDENGEVSLRSLWTLEHVAANGTFKLRSYHSGQYLTNVSAGETALPMSEAGSEFYIEPNTSAKAGEGIVFQIRGGNDCLHEHNAETTGDNAGSSRIVKWGNANSSPASGWRMSLIDDVVEDAPAQTPGKPQNFNLKFTLTKGDDGHMLTISHAGGKTLTMHEDAEGSVLRIVVAAKAAVSRAAGDIELAASDFTADNGSYTAALGSELPQGQYAITVPAGMFKADGQLAATTAGDFKVATDGAVTGIDEVKAATAAADEIFDLQGRRVSKATKGLYIINGKKIYVK